MKKRGIFAMSLAAAAVAFTSCQREVVSKVKGTPVSFHVTANTDGTRSVFGDKVDDTYQVLWTANKQVSFTCDGANLEYATPAVTDDGAKAEFSFDAVVPAGSTTGVLYGFSPKGVYDKNVAENNIPGFTGFNSIFPDEIYLNIPSEQTPLANSCDESAQALFGMQSYDINDQTVNMTFNHVVAYGKMAVTNFSKEIKSVSVTFPENVFGGSCFYCYKGEDAGKLGGMKSATLTLNPDNVVDNVFWFACAPTAGATGSMKIIVTDSKDKTYTKTIDLTAKALPFNQGKVSSFSVNMSGIAADELASVIPDGDYAILAKRSTGNYWFMTTSLGTASTKRYQAVDASISTIPSSIEVSADKLWTVNNTADGIFISTSDGKKMTWSSGNSANLDDNGKPLVIEAVESTSGAYIVSIVSSEPLRTLALNTNSDYNYFAFYEGSQVKELFFVPATEVAAVEYNITIGSISNGSVTPSKSKAVPGETVNVTVTPDNGYQLASLTYNGNDIKEVKSFTMPAANVTVAATFEEVSSVDGDKYLLCTSTSDLVVGAHYIIASGVSGGVNCVSNVSNSNNRKTVAATVSESTIEVADGSTIMTFTLGGETGAWTFYTDNYAGINGYLASASSGKNNYCRVIADKMTCTISFSGNEAVINLAPHTERTLLRYNPNNGTPLFACYSSGQQPVYLYKKK